MKRVIEKTGAPEKTVAFLAECHSRQLRQLDNEHARGQLLMQLPLISKEYGARFDLSPNVLGECVRMIFEKFSYLALEEIREAYRQFVTGEITVKGGEMYGGEFNAAQLGKILSAYSEARRATIAALLRERQEEAEKAREAERAAAMRKDFEETFAALIDGVRQTAKSWHDVPAFWFAAARRRGWLQMSATEAGAILERARKIAAAEEPDRKSIFEKATDPEERAKVIARKIAVFEWLQYQRPQKSNSNTQQ